MNREIKFKAWDILQKKMILPDYSDWEDFFIEPDGTVYISCEKIGSYESYRFKMQAENLQLLQFTGLYELESNKEIFEGDIVDDGYHKGVIEFFGGSFGVWKNKPDGEFVTFSSSWKIIGNIFENPELLEERK